MTTTGVPVMTARHDGGMRFVAEIRGHRIETDQPVEGRGVMTGTPVDVIPIPVPLHPRAGPVPGLCQSI